MQNCIVCLDSAMDPNGAASSQSQSVPESDRPVQERQCYCWTTSQMILLRRGNSLQMAKPFSVRSLELEVIHFGVHYVDLEHEDER